MYTSFHQKILPLHFSGLGTGAHNDAAAVHGQDNNLLPFLNIRALRDHIHGAAVDARRPRGTQLREHLAHLPYKFGSLRRADIALLRA